MNMIGALLQILSNLTSLFNREASADEKIKDSFFSGRRKTQKAVYYARQIFDGTKRFKGLDILLPDILSPAEYKEYKRLRHKFNSYL